MKAQL
jgi:hypothetical protein